MANPLNAYRDNAVLSASPARLLTMLYDRLLVDLTTARDALDASDGPVASYRLRHAGDIIAALAGSLKRDVWDGADGLFSLYMYVASALIRASLFRDRDLVVECIDLMEPLRQAWHQAAASLAGAPAWETSTGAESAEVVAIA